MDKLCDRGPTHNLSQNNWALSGATMGIGQKLHVIEVEFVGVRERKQNQGCVDHLPSGVSNNETPCRLLIQCIITIILKWAVAITSLARDKYVYLKQCRQRRCDSS